MLCMLYGNSDQRCLVYHKAASLAGADDNGYTGGRWWQERLTSSELHYVTHALVDIPPTTCEDGNAESDESCFVVFCTLLAASPITDDELLNTIRSLFATRINECLSGTSPNDLRARANIHSWSQTLLQILSDSNTRDSQLALIPKIPPDLIRYAKSNHTSDEGITVVFISSSAVAMQLGCRITYSDDILDDMKKLVALMRESIEGNDNDSADDARQRWKKVIEVIAQSQGVH
ncbi:hypothetical protein F5146DRAFT_542561 [Armillaria mellea]|nr:hypothetical protein F5146DRAFT_542561 [Armillaria mellea]